MEHCDSHAGRRSARRHVRSTCTAAGLACAAWLAAGAASAVSYDVVLAIDKSSSMVSELATISTAFPTLNANILANGDDPRYALILVDAAACTLAQDLTTAATMQTALAGVVANGTGTDFALAMRDCLPQVSFRANRPRYAILLTDVAPDDGSTLAERDAAVAGMISKQAVFPLTGLFTSSSPALDNMPLLKDLVRRSSCFGGIGNPPWFPLTDAASVAQLVPGQLAPTPWTCHALFTDGFEECGLARWSSGTEVSPAVQITALTPALLAQAFGACGPSLTAAAFVLADGTTPATGPLSDMSNFQSAILQTFGTGGIAATAGGAMIALSSGRARDVSMPAFIAPEPGQAYGHDCTAPALYTSAHGGQVPGSPGCPNGANATRDSVGLRLTFLVPAGAKRLAFDWRFLSSDFPGWNCTAFSDSFLSIVTTGSSPGLPLDRSVALDSQGGPISSGSADMVICNGCADGTGALAGTGYGITEASATRWQTAYVPVVAGETLVLDLIAFDISDGQVDNIVFLDGMRWVFE